MIESIKLYAKISSSKVLGPKNRFVIWVQGCPFRCKECIAPDSIDFSGGYYYSIEKLATEVLETQNIEGITLSGGEPFSQAKALCLLLEKIKKVKDLGVVIYSGFTLKKLLDKSKTDNFVKKLLNYTDILIDGNYVPSLNNNIALRGSANQQVHFLSERYVDYKSLYDCPERQVEFHLGEEFMMVGVPSQKQYQAWQTLTLDKTK